MVGTAADIQVVQKFPAPVLCLRFPETGNELRYDEILKSRKIRQQMMKLINETDFCSPYCGPSTVIKVRCRFSAYIHDGRKYGNGSDR